MPDSRTETKPRLFVPLLGGVLVLFLFLLGGCSQNVEKLNSDETPPPPPPRSSDLVGALGGGKGAGAALGAGVGTGTGMGAGAGAGTGAGAGLGADLGVTRGTGPGITGVVSITPELADEVGPGAVLYLIARSPGGSALAAKRVVRPTFPLRFFLGQESAMFAGQSLEGPVDLIARVAQNGSASPVRPGDLEGSCADNPVPVGDADVIEVLIDTRR